MPALRWCWRCKAAHGPRCPKREAERAPQRDASIMKLLMRAKPRRCAWCGRRKGLRIDHITPLSQGGLTTRDNLQWLCDEHHKAKTARERAENK